MKFIALQKSNEGKVDPVYLCTINVHSDINELPD